MQTIKIHYTPIQLTLYYLEAKKEIINPSGRQVHEYMGEAKEYFDNIFYSNTNKKRELEEIKNYFGYTNPQWDEIVKKNSHWAAIPTENEQNCNKAIRKYLWKELIINQTYYNPNYTYACLSDQFNRKRTAKEPLIDRFKDSVSGVFHYCLKWEPFNNIHKLLNS